MYGRYTKDLGEYAKDEARKLKILEKRRKQEDKIRNKVHHSQGFQFLLKHFMQNYLSRVHQIFVNFQELFGKQTYRFIQVLTWIWKNSFARLGEDWVYLALLGIMMAVISFIMDKGVVMCTNG